MLLYIAHTKPISMDYKRQLHLSCLSQRVLIAFPLAPLVRSVADTFAVNVMKSICSWMICCIRISIALIVLIKRIIIQALLPKGATAAAGASPRADQFIFSYKGYGKTWPPVN